jgi:hypothetical protein
MTTQVGFLGSDYRSFELLMAACVALSVPIWSAVLLSFSDLSERAKAPQITAGDAVPIKVRPVLDLDVAMLKKGGKNVGYKLPDMWQKKEPQPAQATKRQAHVSSKAKGDLDSIPDAGLEVSDASEAPAEDAAVSDDPDASTEPVDTPDAEPTAAQGGGDPEGSEHGQTTVLKNRALQLYKGRIYSFLYAGWPGTCPAGTPKECKAAVTYTIAGLTVASVSSGGCGSGPFDAQAGAHAQSKIGQSIPPPPENYPDIAPSNFTVTYGCK